MVFAAKFSILFPLKLNVSAKSDLHMKRSLKLTRENLQSSMENAGSFKVRFELGPFEMENMGFLI